MATSIEKFKLEERVRISFLKHRGNVLEVQEETGVPLEYINKLAKKIKGRAKRDVDYLVANSIMQHILIGVEQRSIRFQEILKSLEGKMIYSVSSCCNSTYEIMKGEEGIDYYVCDTCGNTCRIKREIQNNVISKIHETLHEQRLEDQFLTEAAIKLGYTNLQPVPVNKITQNNIILGDKNVKIDPQLTEKAENLTGADREQVRKTIESKIINSDSEEALD